MHHGREEEGKRSFAQRQLVPLFDDVKAGFLLRAEEIRDHFPHLIVADDRACRIFGHYARDIRRVVGFHVLHGQIIQIPPAEPGGDV